MHTPRAPRGPEIKRSHREASRTAVEHYRLSNPSDVAWNHRSALPHSAQPPPQIMYVKTLLAKHCLKRGLEQRKFGPISSAIAGAFRHDTTQCRCCIRLAPNQIQKHVVQI